MYQGHGDSDKRINILFDEVTQHYHVIANMTGAMAKRYVCEGCNKGCKFGKVHTCEHTCSDFMLSPPCISVGPRFPCDLCNRHFRSRTSFDKNKKKRQGKSKKKSACELRKCCSTCGASITFRMKECNERFFVTCNENKEFGHLSFMRPLVNMPVSSEH
jgi:hypothetical protein